MSHHPFFSICIPAFNRSRFLRELLDSIRSQSFTDYEVVIAEDLSPERDDIINITNVYSDLLPLRVILNVENLGYDKNLRQLIKNANGRFILFLGNDDILAEDALEIASSYLLINRNVTCVIRDYAVFRGSLSNIEYVVRYFAETTVFSGKERFARGVRRFGVLSGLIFDREIAKKTLTDIYDGALYYQTYLGIECLKRGSLLYISSLLTYSRDDVTPDFGNSGNESFYTPGLYTSKARYQMISGVTGIYKSSLIVENEEIVSDVERDYATYILPFFKDQINSGFNNYFWLWKSVGQLGYRRYFRYHFIVWTAFILKKQGLLIAEKSFRCLRSLLLR